MSIGALLILNDIVQNICRIFYATYPYIKIDIKSEYPNVFITRKIVNDGSKYFGPYANAR